MLKKTILAFVVICLFVAGCFGWQYYQRIYSSNVSLEVSDDEYLYIPTGSTLEDVVQLLYAKGVILNKETFEWVARKKHYRGKNVKAGKYLLKNGMSNNKLINSLRQGNGALQVKITFNNVRTIEEIAGKVSKTIEADSLELLNLLNDKAIFETYGFDKNTILTLLLPDTYLFYWNTSAEEFLERMAKEYKNFWTEKRKRKAKKLGLSQSEVTVLASIVKEEQNRHYDEHFTIAGLYINRLKKGMRLESDPTLKYAWSDFSIQRVRNKHKEIDSPYNTYKKYGLPPGPICLPEKSVIDAVLNYKKTDYIFMCAKSDFSGYHSFSETYEQHKEYADAYQDELDKRGY